MRLGIYTVRDFIYHIPSRYNDYSLVTPIRKANPSEVVTIKGTITDMKTFVTKNGKRIVEGSVIDDSGSIKVLWFNQQYLLKILGIGDEVSFSGTVTWFGSKIVLSNPQYEIIRHKNEENLHTGRIVPVYPETEGITSKWLRNRIHFLLQTVGGQIEEYLPELIRNSHELMLLPQALTTIHFPNSLEEAEKAKRRLAFDELLVLHVRAKLLRNEWQKSQTGIAFKVKKNDQKAFISALPFSLTQDQNQAIEELSRDLTQSIPMNRLLVGDVGSGKTILAAYAMYIAYVSGFSSVLMAPTQILAEQHFATLQKILTPLGIQVDIITGSSSTITSENSQDLFGQDTKKVIVGTHALINNQDYMGTVGLVVIDEQHRFGVKQRGALLEERTDKKTPHLFTMTATPIPRTIAKTFFGNVDVSFLKNPPLGRQKIKTWLVPNDKRQKAYDWMAKQIKETQGQVFIICPLIETSESETLTSVKAVTEEYAVLKKIFPTLSIGLLHGRMKGKEKTQILTDFRGKKYHILLATPVVEVGIDIANATIMVIEGADRFGLGGLHQLRGRVGRGEKQSYCLLFTESLEEKTLTRLKAMETIHSGPELAELDLKLRGAGDVFGIRQHGIPMLKIATLSDMDLMTETKTAAESIIDDDLELSHLPHLRELAKKDIIAVSASD